MSTSKTAAESATIRPIEDLNADVEIVTVPISSDETRPASLSIEDPVYVQELPPIDGGIKAWTFCVSAFFVETMVWGYGFRYASGII